MNLRRLSILLFTVLIVSSCDSDDVAQVIDTPAPTTEELIIADAYAIRDALEAYAADNEGRYPHFTLPPFTPYLPGGEKVTNRYSGLANLPVFNFAQWPGEIGVVLFYDDNGDTRGYRLVARGRDGELVQLENVSAFSQDLANAYDLIMSNLDAMWAAVNMFFEQAGYYAADTSGDRTPSGDTLIDFLPDGNLLTNPFSGIRTEPQDGSGLALPGAIGYIGEDSGSGSIDAFVIEAYSVSTDVMVTLTKQSPEDEVTRYSFEELREAVAAFAGLNAGVPPSDIDSDQTPGGDTVQDLIAHDHTNPYTEAPAYSNGLATSRGEVGYLPIIENDVVVGYVINAMGLFDELERFEATR